MFRAILFDFDGVLADTEPLHFRALQELLKGEGIPLTQEEYASEFLGFDDRGCFQAIYQKAGQALSKKKRDGLIRSKNEKMLQIINSSNLLLPGVREVLLLLKERHHLAIVSGAFRSEILSILRKEKMESFFEVIVAADDVDQGKPNPEGFLTALRLLNRDHIPESEMLLAGECLVVEDSPWGIEAAKKAGMKSVAVTNSYKSADLYTADWVIGSLGEMNGIVGTG